MSITNTLRASDITWDLIYSILAAVLIAAWACIPA